MKICPDKHRSNPDSKFCCQCGTKELVEEPTCAKCGFRTFYSDKFCEQCGEKLEGR